MYVGSEEENIHPADRGSGLDFIPFLFELATPGISETGLPFPHPDLSKVIGLSRGK